MQDWANSLKVLTKNLQDAKKIFLTEIVLFCKILQQLILFLSQELFSDRSRLCMRLSLGTSGATLTGQLSRWRLSRQNRETLLFGLG